MCKTNHSLYFENWIATYSAIILSPQKRSQKSDTEKKKKRKKKEKKKKRKKKWSLQHLWFLGSHPSKY